MNKFTKVLLAALFITTASSSLYALPRGLQEQADQTSATPHASSTLNKISALLFTLNILQNVSTLTSSEFIVTKIASLMLLWYSAKNLFDLQPRFQHIFITGVYPQSN